MRIVSSLKQGSANQQFPCKLYEHVLRQPITALHISSRTQSRSAILPLQLHSISLEEPRRARNRSVELKATVCLSGRRPSVDYNSNNLQSLHICRLNYMYSHTYNFHRSTHTHTHTLGVCSVPFALLPAQAR